MWADVKQRVNEGAGFGDALSTHPRIFTGLYVNMVRAGETSGALDRVAERPCYRATVSGHTTGSFDFFLHIRDQWRSLWITATVLIVFGVILGLCDMLGKRVKTLETTTYRDGLLIGLAQVLALVPGVSRSGGTIAGGLFMGYTREAAARYSFLLAIPAVLLSGFQQLFDIADEPVEPAWGPIAVATVISFVIGYAVIAWLLRYISTHNFSIFVIYRIVLALVLFALLGTGVLAA